VLVLKEEQPRHLDDEQMEQYALGELAPEAIPAFEQHLLICYACQDRMAEMDAGVEAMQAEARLVRAHEMQSKSKAGVS
jgi:anti-sigma factor RsiW